MTILNTTINTAIITAATIFLNIGTAFACNSSAGDGWTVRDDRGWVCKADAAQMQAVPSAVCHPNKSSAKPYPHEYTPLSPHVCAVNIRVITAHTCVILCMICGEYRP